ncbi:MAG: GNAT family N-acetyltransferase [Bacteriovoracaceae bacterium]|nr:GNAT family N-acetyltransferase [Bacteriovoracaceae bacterium]
MRESIKKAWLLFESGKFQEAKAEWELVLAKNASDENLSSYCYTLCSLKEFEQARDIYHKLWDKTENHRYLHQLCMVEREAGNLDLAMDYINRETKLIDTSDALANSANLYEKGKLLELKGEIDLALEQALKCDSVAMKCDDLTMKACAKRLLGDIYRAQKNIDSLMFYLSSLMFFSKARDHYGVMELMNKLSDIEISNPQNEDVGKLYEIEFENYGIGEATEKKTFKEIVSYINKQKVCDYILKKISIQNELVGFYCAVIDEENCDFVDIAVSKQWQGKGIGSILMGDFFALLSSSIQEVNLEVRAGNKSAIKLYGNFDFQQVRRIENYYEDGEDALKMRYTVHS